MALNEEFTLEGRNILLPYPRDQGLMNCCYSYSTGEAVQALFASTYSIDPFELSTQQIVDHVPIMFDYEGHRMKRDRQGCYYSNHPNVLEYIWSVGLVKDEEYVKRLNRRDEDVLPIPNVTKYFISGYEFVFQIGLPMHLRKHYETEKTVEEINNILRHQPMVGATRVRKSFEQFRGYRVYLGPTANELAAEELAEQQRMAAPEVAPPPRIILHSILIVGYGIRDGVHYYKIKNSHGITWGVQGYGKIQRDLVYRLAYPIGPTEIKVEPEKVASPVTVIKNTKSPRIKRHEGRPKTSKSRMQFGSQGKRFGTEATTKRKHPTHESCKTDAVWGVELKPGKPFTHIFEKEQGRLHVSQATLSTGSTSMTSIVQCQVGDKKSICLCSLLPGKIEKCPLDLEFEEYHEDVTFLVVGSDNVRLSGFFYGERKDFFGDESGSDPYEEDVVDGARDDSIEFEYDMDDEDKDGSGDDDFRMYPPSCVPNSGVKTEEILEEGKPTDESGTIENSTVVKGNTDSPLLESEDEDGFAPRESKRNLVRSKRSDGIEDEDTCEEAQNEKARYTAAGERKGLKRKVYNDTSIANDFQRGSEKMKKKKNASQLEVEKNAETKPYTMRSTETRSVMEGGDA